MIALGIVIFIVILEILGTLIALGLCRIAAGSDEDLRASFSAQPHLGVSSESGPPYLSSG